jgi:hypothetical protein
MSRDLRHAHVDKPDPPPTVEHIMKAHEGIDVLDPDWRLHPGMAHEADHRAHPGASHDRFKIDGAQTARMSDRPRVCGHGHTHSHGEVGKDWCPGVLPSIAEAWRAQLVDQMNAVPLVKDTDLAQVTISAEVLNEICAVLGYVSLGRTHVRQNWHLAPDATARRLLGLLREE